MAIHILDTQAVIAKLKADVPSLKDVQGAASLEAALKNGVRTAPICFVIPLTEKANRNTTGTQVVTQKITARFAIVFAVKDITDGRGENAIAHSLRAIRLAVMNALVGWAPASNYSLCEFDDGTLFKVASSMVFWRDNFLVTHTNES